MPTIPIRNTGATIDQTFTRAVAGVQAGVLSGTTNASGDITVTFPQAYATATGLTVVGVAFTTSAYTVTVTAVTATTATFRARALTDGSVLASGGFTVHWFAMGTI